MKKIIFLASLLTAFTYTGFAQQERIHITGFGGYSFSQSFDIDGYSVHIDDSWRYGGGLEFAIRPLYGIELIYQYQATQASINGYYNYYVAPTDITISYILLGGIRYLPVFGNVIIPYGGLNAGMAIVSARSTDATKFAWGGKLGLKIKTSSRLSFRLQADMYSVVGAVSSSVWFSGGQSGVSLSGTSSTYQFGFTGGVSIGL